VPKKPSILVVYPSFYSYSSPTLRDEIKSAPLALASYLAQLFPVEYADFEVSIGCPGSQVQIRRYERKVREYLENHRFDILALSCWTSLSYRATMTTARIARELYPNSLIVVGGYHPTARPDDFRTPDVIVDYVIRGEGEMALKEVAEAFPVAGRPPETKVIDSPSLQPDSYVSMNWDLVDGLTRSESRKGIGTICLFLSRGCPFECTFCVESLKDRCWRPMPPSQAIEQIQDAVDRHHVQAIGFGDATFGVQAKWRKEFLRLLTDLKPSCWILFETRPEFLDEKDVKALAQLKVEIQFGIESGSPTMLRLMKKTTQPEKFLAKFKATSRFLSAHGIVHGANLIFNHPGETRQTLEETFAFMDDLLNERQSSLIWACHGYLHFPGSELDRNQAFYEQEFGAQFLGGDWWQKDEDPYVNARRVVPSIDLRGERMDLWKQMFKDRIDAFKSSLSPDAFRLAAENYYQQWKFDPKYIGTSH
jgi:radical SAM superfamily enzyme YgiQ (UPF0313 family)